MRAPTPARRSARWPRRRRRRLAGIDVAQIYAVTFGLGTACLGAAACLLMPTYYVTRSRGNAFVLVAFTIVVLGGMGASSGALVGGFLSAWSNPCPACFSASRSARSASR